MITSGIRGLEKNTAGPKEELLSPGPERFEVGSASIFLDEFVSKTSVSELSLYVRSIFSSHS
jgi:hypothetical protein